MTAVLTGGKKRSDLQLSRTSTTPDLRAVMCDF